MKAVCKFPREDFPRLVERPIPEVGPNDVLVKVAYAGICKTDLKVARGELPCNPNGVVLGHEFSGTIVGCGKSIDPDIVIERCVSAIPMLDNESDRMLGKDVDGCFAEYVAVPFSSLVQLYHDNMKVNAYMEPITAALAPAQALEMGRYSPNSTIVAGDPNDRIAKLTALCYSWRFGLKQQIPIISPEKLIIESELGKSDGYDCIIECCPEHAGRLLKCLNYRGTLVLKSRGYCELTGVVVNDIVMRELEIVGAKYLTNIEEVCIRDFIYLHEAELRKMIDDRDYKLEEFADALKAASKPDAKKVMFKCAQ